MRVVPPGSVTSAAARGDGRRASAPRRLDDSGTVVPARSRLRCTHAKSRPMPRQRAASVGLRGAQSRRGSAILRPPRRGSAAAPRRIHATQSAVRGGAPLIAVTFRAASPTQERPPIGSRSAGRRRRRVRSGRRCPPPPDRVLDRDASGRADDSIASASNIRGSRRTRAPPRRAPRADRGRRMRGGTYLGHLRHASGGRGRRGRGPSRNAFLSRRPGPFCNARSLRIRRPRPALLPPLPPNSPPPFLLRDAFPRRRSGTPRSVPGALRP